MPVMDDSTVISSLGVYRHLTGVSFPDPVADPHWAHRIRRAVSRGTVQASVDQALLSDTQLPDALADALRIAWDHGMAEYLEASVSQGLRVFVETPDRANEQTITTRMRGVDGVDSVVLIDRTLNGPAVWGWPLNVGVAGDDVITAVERYDHQKLISVTTASQPGKSCDLLIVESADDQRLRKNFGAGTGFLLLFVEDSDAVRADTLRRLNQTIRLRAGAVVRRPDNIETFVHRFLDELAHDHPPDIATVRAAEDVTDAIVIGDPEFLSRARVSAVTADFEGVIEQLYTANEIEADAFKSAMVKMKAMPELTTPGWLAEGGAATDSVINLASIRTMIPAPTRGTAARAAAARHLQTQVFEQSDAGLVQRTRSFEAGACHEVRVRVGPTGLDWISVQHPFPDKELPNSESHLTVRILVPYPMKEPDVQEIKISATGASTVARFEIEVPMDMEHLEANLIVLHQGKHVQTGTLSGPVTRGELADAATGITFTRGTASTADPLHQRSFDLVIWKDGHELALSEFDPSARGDAPTHITREPSLSGIDFVLDGIRDELFLAAQKTDQLSAGLETAGLPMLRSLAEQGQYLRQKLFGDDAMAHVRHVQVVSPHSADFFPVDFLYDYVLPDEGAALCPEFKRSDGPDCTDACLARGGNAGIVCPSGFWALNRIIERQVRPKDHADCHQPESTQQQPELMPLSGIIFSASDEVNAGNPGRVKDTVAEMHQWTPVYTANTWSAWEKHVADHYPALLVVLPHNIETTPFHKLRIAADEDLALHRIRPRHVAPTGAPVGPAVLLLGCNTANAPVRYQDFVNQFRCAGAVLVIGTLTYVLGPQAAHLAREFVAQIWASAESETIGEIMRQVRGRMLVRDNPMALAITAFGDADWRFQVREHG